MSCQDIIDRFDQSDCAQLYAEFRRKVGRIKSSNYDISDICNLDCEGCLFFAGADYKSHSDNQSLELWDSFFRAEADRGVNFAYVAGAEPSLQPERLRLIAKHIPKGVIFTNGIKKIPEDISYRIHISLWGDQQDNLVTRGADNSRKAFRNYKDDPRAIFVYTINSRNICNIREMVRQVSENGSKISFSYFTPTDEYQYGIIQGTDKSSALMLDRLDYVRAHRAIAQSMEDYPEAVCYSLEFDQWVQQESLYRLDENGIAIDCGARSTKHHRHYGVDLKPSQGKCCLPNLVCSECRAYAPAYASFLARWPSRLENTDEFSRWLAVWATWSDLFLND